MGNQVENLIVVPDAVSPPHPTNVLGKPGQEKGASAAPEETKETRGQHHACETPVWSAGSSIEGGLTVYTLLLHSVGSSQNEFTRKFCTFCVWVRSRLIKMRTTTSNDLTTRCLELSQLDPSSASGERPLFDEHDDDDDDYHYGYGGKDGLRVVLLAPDRPPGAPPAKPTTSPAEGEAITEVATNATNAAGNADVDPDAIRPAPVLLGGWSGAGDVSRFWRDGGMLAVARSKGKTGKERRPSRTEVG